MTISDEVRRYRLAKRQKFERACALRADSRFDSYVHHTFPGVYDMAEHHRLIIEKLQGVESGSVKRLMIFMPPRRGKSELASVRFPAWFLGRNPDKNIIACSHTAALAYDFSRKVRRQFELDEWPFDLGLQDDSRSVQKWGIEGHEGGYLAAGIGAGIAGSGAHVLLVDDPVKSREHARSAVYRDRAYEWFFADAYTRLAPHGAICLVMTRWHEDDLAGRLLEDMKKGGEQWEILELKEIAEEGDNDPLGRQAGEALWPKRFSAESTRSIRKTQPFVWEPLFQQRPGALTGGIFQSGWLRGRYDPAVLPEFDMVVQTTDSAFSEDTSADYSVIATWGATQTHFYLLDIWRERAPYPTLISSLKACFAKWEHLSPWVWIENKASGQSAIQTLRSESNIPARKFEPKGSKESRGQDASRYFAAGRVLLPEGAPFLSDFIEEHRKFPTASHDDQVDTTAMAILKLARGVGVSGEPIEDENDDER